MPEHRKVISLGTADLRDHCKGFTAETVYHVGYACFKSDSMDRQAYLSAEVVMFTDHNDQTVIIKNRYANAGLVTPISPTTGWQR